MKRVSIAIVEPSPIIMEGVATIVGHNPSLRVVGAVATLGELQALMRNTEVDVVVAAVGLVRDIESVAENAYSSTIVLVVRLSGVCWN